MNIIALVGRLTADPELKHTQSGIIGGGAQETFQKPFLGLLESEKNAKKPSIRRASILFYKVNSRYECICNLPKYRKNNFLLDRS